MPEILRSHRRKVGYIEHIVFRCIRFISVIDLCERNICKVNLAPFSLKLPLHDTGGDILDIVLDIQANLRGDNGIKFVGIVCILCEIIVFAGRRHRDKFFAIPIDDFQSIRDLDAAVVVIPLDVASPQADRLIKVILHPRIERVW